ncbi:hypothetical protein TNCV_3944831 [Trichonephila clavipes]|nr:hypothetical protein TNCV_3944831 [Trichonephila clavipes]
MALNLNLKNDNGMDLSLPSSNNTSPSGTPQETNCERLKVIVTDIQKFAIIIENMKSMINALRLNGVTEESDPTLVDNFQSLVHYGEIQHLAVSEFSSHSPCNTPGCTIHNTPNCSPAKNTSQEFPPLPKIASVKGKENNDGFIPSSLLEGFQKIPEPIQNRGIKS